VRTRLTGLLVTCLVAATAAGCSDEGETPEPAPSSAPSASVSSSPTASDEPLALSVYGVPPALAAYRDAANAFSRDSAVPVEVETHPNAAAAAEDVMSQLRGQGPAPDVFLLGHDFLPAMIATDRLQHVDQALEERGLQFGDGYQRVGLTAFSAEDVLQCMPVDTSPRVLFVNQEQVRPRDLAIRGVPLPEQRQWDWEAFEAAARVIAREHQGQKGFHAVHLPVDMEVLTALVRSAGGDVVDDVDQPTTLMLGSDEAREVIQAYLGLGRVGSVALSDQEAARRSALERFGDGELAMMVGTRADVPALRESGVPFDVMPLPSFASPRTVADIAGLCVDRRSDRLEDALDLVAFLAGDQGSTVLARSGAVVPANLDVAFSPVFAQRGQRPRSVQVFGSALARSGYMPFSTAWHDVASRVEQALSRMAAGGRDLAPLLERRLPQIDERSQAAFEQATSTPDEEQQEEE
jgi:multiple sugar transport system substrate-binding protein